MTAPLAGEQLVLIPFITDLMMSRTLPESEIAKCLAASLVPLYVVLVTLTRSREPDLVA